MQMDNCIRLQQGGCGLRGSGQTLILGISWFETVHVLVGELSEAQRRKDVGLAGL